MFSFALQQKCNAKEIKSKGFYKLSIQAFLEEKFLSLLTKIMLSLCLLIISALSIICSCTTYYTSEESGKSTYYGGNPSGNACGYSDVPESSFPFGYYTACGTDNFDSGYGCGRCYEITCVGPYDSSNTGCSCSSTTPTV